MTNIHYISKLFNIAPNKIPKNVLQYFVTWTDRHICNDIGKTGKTLSLGKTLFDDIQPFDFNQVAKKMYKQYKTEHFEKLLHININPNNIYSCDTKKVKYYDELITYYLQCRPKISILTCWDIVKSDDIKSLVNFLKKNGNVYYIRKLQFTDKQLESLIYQIYIDAKRLSNPESIREKIQYSSNSKGIKTIHVIVFDNINNLKLSGGKSEFKTDIRNILLKKYGDKFRGDDFIHINDHYCQTIEYAQIYFNKYSRRHLQNFNLDKFYNHDYKKSKIMLLTYKKWLMINTTLLQRINFCLMSGATLFTHAIRPTKDIDGIYIDGDNKLDKLVKEFFFNEKTKFFFSDIGSENWKQTWKESNKKWLDLLQIKNMNELILNPRYHYYFLGLKVFRLDYEIYRKLKITQSPKTFADTYYMNLNTKINIKDFENNKKILDFVKSKDSAYYNKFKSFLNKNYNIKLIK